MITEKEILDCCTYHTTYAFNAYVRLTAALRKN